MDLSILPRYQHVLDELDTAWEEVHDSKASRVVLLEGPSGAYKTQTVESFLQTSQAPGVSGYGSGVPAPYLPLRQIFESLVRLEPVQEALSRDSEDVSDDWQMALTALAQLLPLLNLMADPAWNALKRWQPAGTGQILADDSFEPDQPLRPVTLPGLLTLALGEVAALLPFVMLLEDLDQADTATVDALMMDILPALQNSQVLVIATFTPAERQPTDALARFIQTALDIPETRHLKLSPLEASEVVRVLSDTVPELREERLTDLAQQVQARSHGIPARVQDLMTWLKSLGADALRSSLEIPDHGKFIQERFDLLQDDARDILQIASVQGAYFCLEVAAKAGGCDSQAVADLFSDDMLAFFVRFDATVRLQDRDLHWYHFRGQHIHDWIYDTISGERYNWLHRNAALALEHVYSGETGVIAGRLAEYFEKGGVPKKAALYFADIARRANDQGASMEALDYTRQGLANLDVVDDKMPGLRCRLLLEQGRALIGTEESYHAESILREALDFAREAQNIQLEMEVKRNLGEVLFNRNVWDEGLELLEQAIDLAAEQRAWKVVVEGMERLRNCYIKLKPKLFLSICDRMIAMMQKDSSPETLLTIAEILEDKGWVQYYQSKHSKALETLDRAFHYLELLEYSERYPNVHYKIHLVRARVFRLLEKYPKSLEEADKAITWAYASHNRKNIAWAHDAKAKTLRRMGLEHLEEGEREYKIILKLLRSSSDLVTLAMMEQFYGLFLSYSGHKRRAQKLYAHSYEHRLAANDFYNLQGSRNDLAAIDKYLGDFQSALVTYQQLLSEGLAQGDKYRQSLSLNHLGDIYRILNRLDKAESAHFKAILLCDEIDSMGRKVIALRRLSQVYLCGWRLDKARLILDEAISLSREKVATTLASGESHLNTICLGRLLLCEGDLRKASNKLIESIDELSKLQRRIWIGIGYLNLGLVNLLAGNLEDALSFVQDALEFLSPTESWRSTEAHHLLARCYLTLGELERAQNEIDRAKAEFMDLGLFHRVYQAESTELRIQEARESGNPDQWREMSYEELRYDFNHLGI